MNGSLGREQASYDKQIVRNYLETLVSAGSWDKTPPGPDLPADVIERTMRRYLEAYEHLTGAKTRTLERLDWDTYKELSHSPPYFTSDGHSIELFLM